jgi:hypothetical protein
MFLGCVSQLSLNGENSSNVEHKGHVGLGLLKGEKISKTFSDDPQIQIIVNKNFSKTHFLLCLFHPQMNARGEGFPKHLGLLQVGQWNHLFENTDVGGCPFMG